MVRLTSAVFRGPRRFDIVVGTFACRRRSSANCGGDVHGPIAATFSPDGRWIAYHTASGSTIHTTFVRPFPPTDEVHEISHERRRTRSGVVARRTGAVFNSGAGAAFAVKVQFAPSFSFSPPERLPPAGLMGPGDIPRNFDILPDGPRFIGREIAEDETGRAGGPQRVEVVANL